MLTARPPERLFHLVFESHEEGPCAESEEKREPVSDIDTGVVDSLKVLDPDGRLEKRTNSRHAGMSALCHVWTAPSWEGFFHVCRLVGAAMCSACWCGSHDRWP